MTRRLLFVLAVAACGARTQPEQLTHKPAAGDLQQQVLDGIAPSFADVCYAGPIWGALDRPAEGKRLDALLAEIVAKPSPTSREQVCAETLSIAHVLRAA